MEVQFEHKLPIQRFGLFFGIDFINIMIGTLKTL